MDWFVNLYFYILIEYSLNEYFFLIYLDERKIFGKVLIIVKVINWFVWIFWLFMFYKNM